MSPTPSPSLPRLVVTGAGGFVARELVATLARSGRWNVEGWSRAASGPAPQGAQLVRHDFRDVQHSVELLRGVHTLAHLAASTGKQRAKVHFETNLDGTRQLLAAAREAGVQRVLFVSTVAVRYPERDHYPYAEAKRQAEELVRASDFDWGIARPTIVLGPGSGLGAAFAKLALGSKVKLFGPGTVRVQPIDVRDLARALAAWLDEPRLGRAVREFGGSESTTLQDFLQRVRRAAQCSEAKVQHLPLGLAERVLAGLEPLLFPLLPLTAGQLYAFKYDSTAEANGAWQAERATLRGLDALASDLAAEHG